MRKRMLNEINYAVKRIDELSKTKKLKVISHFDADGITSAAIFARMLDRWGKKFSLEIVKGLEKDFVKNLSEDQVLIFLDLASGSLSYLKEKKTEVFVFDHHEIVQKIPENVVMINPVLRKSEPMSGAAICYLFAKAVSAQNTDLANLAVIGMVGDFMDKSIGKVFSGILDDSESVVKKGLLIYPSTRPLDRALEYSSNPFIPGVTGSYRGVISLLRDAGIEKTNGKYKALYELSEEEMKNLVTAIMLKNVGNSNEESIIGNLFLLKFFNKLEDSRELSALINACSRMGHPEVALGFCLGNKSFRKDAEKIYITYKQSLISALKYAYEVDKISGKDYMILNAKDKIKDTIIGTVTSIISHSPVYKEGLVIIALAYAERTQDVNSDKDKGEMIKVSARLAGRKGRNVREILSKVVVPLGGEVGGHPAAAGCLISRKNEKEFIEELKKVLDVELVEV